MGLGAGRDAVLYSEAAAGRLMDWFEKQLQNDQPASGEAARLDRPALAASRLWDFALHDHEQGHEPGE